MNDNFLQHMNKRPDILTEVWTALAQPACYVTPCIFRLYIERMLQSYLQLSHRAPSLKQAVMLMLTFQVYNQNTSLFLENSH